MYMCLCGYVECEKARVQGLRIARWMCAGSSFSICFGKDALGTYMKHGCTCVQPCILVLISMHLGEFYVSLCFEDLY